MNSQPYLLNNAQKAFTEIPPAVRKLFLKAAVLFIAWVAIYNYYLLPDHSVDDFLTTVMADMTIWTLKLFYGAQPIHLIHINGNPVIKIQNTFALCILDGCNGLELYVTYLGFLFCLSSSWKNRLRYALLGIGCIFSLNLSRMVVLAFMQRIGFIYINFIHHYLFTLVVYGAIFYLWFLYLKTIKTWEVN